MRRQAQAPTPIRTDIEGAKHISTEHIAAWEMGRLHAKIESGFRVLVRGLGHVLMPPQMQVVGSVSEAVKKTAAHTRRGRPNANAAPPWPLKQHGIDQTEYTISTPAEHLPRTNAWQQACGD